MKADPKAQAAAAPKGSKKKLVTIIALALLVVGAGGAAWYFMQPQGAERRAVKAEAPEYVPIESFTVNLQPENGEQYLQIAFTLQVPSQKDGDVIKANMAMVRSRMLLLLSGKKASEIATVEGKRHLAREIVATLKQPFAVKGEPQQVSDVLYTAFIIQ
jgi:flagellar FliL protein